MDLKSRNFNFLAGKKTSNLRINYVKHWLPRPVWARKQKFRFSQLLAGWAKKSDINPTDLNKELHNT